MPACRAIGDSVKEEIESQLACLIGEPLSNMMRYAGCQRFSFGQPYERLNRRGKPIILFDYAIVASCLWEIQCDGEYVVGRHDFGPGDIRRDSAAQWFYDLVRAQSLKVTQIEAMANGGLTVAFTDEIVLSVTPGLPVKQRYSKTQKKLRALMLRDGELWRLMPKKQSDEEPPHFVVTADGWYGPDE